MGSGVDIVVLGVDISVLVLNALGLSVDISVLVSNAPILNVDIRIWVSSGVSTRSSMAVSGTRGHRGEGGGA